MKKHHSKTNQKTKAEKREKSRKLKYRSLAVIFGLCFIISALLAFMSPEQACGGIETTCYAVQNSSYEKTLGINNSYFGLIAFSILGILALYQINEPNKKTKKVLTYGIIAGALFAIYFFYLQFFVIKALCRYCMVVDTGSILTLFIMVFWKE
jgi:uncharacterized membrane protein